MLRSVTSQIATDVSNDRFAFISRNVDKDVTSRNIWLFKIKLWFITPRGLLRGVRWFKTDVSELPMISIFKVQAFFFLYSMTFEDGTDSTATSVSNHVTPRNDTEDGRIRFNRDGSLRSLVSSDVFEWVYLGLFLVREIFSQNRLLILKISIKKKWVGEIYLARDSVNTIINLLLRKKTEFHDYTSATESCLIVTARGFLPLACFSPSHQSHQSIWRICSSECHVI